MRSYNDYITFGSKAFESNFWADIRSRHWIIERTFTHRQDSMLSLASNVPEQGSWIGTTKGRTMSHQGVITSTETKS